MVVDDMGLAAQVRSLTDYDESILTDAELQAVIDLAKEEFWADTDTSITFYDGNKQADRALFWLSCLFSKVKVGELEAPDFEIAELQIDQASESERLGIWLDKYQRYRDGVVAGSTAKITQIARPNRTYRFDN